MDINKELIELYTLEQKAAAMRAAWQSTEDAIMQKQKELLAIDTENWDEDRYFAPPELLEKGVIAKISVGCVVSFHPVER